MKRELLKREIEKESTELKVRGVSSPRAQQGVVRLQGSTGQFVQTMSLRKSFYTMQRAHDVLDSGKCVLH